MSQAEVQGGLITSEGGEKLSENQLGGSQMGRAGSVGEGAEEYQQQPYYGAPAHVGVSPHMAKLTNSLPSKSGPGFDGQNEKVPVKTMLQIAVEDSGRDAEVCQPLVDQMEKIFGADNVAGLCSTVGETFVGSIVCGIPEGLGLLEFSEEDYLGRSQYRGTFDEGMRHGLGVLRWGDGTVYEGEFRENRPRGYGVETYADGGVYSGQFSDDSRNG
eukprot:CAMPEP_0169436866 /NCGR_PEP_ID=MMETSP1042-20121227/5827_1 /TAXON_ID=464988 /ORGANISM="Hemiselmis andersenii, Strain CCMP1180" /LENGTH=214 /DNA_ID=CAMNT_0009547609 /DNA_START=60 /DNA_END=701 /DNA_ORIENTATION=-